MRERARATERERARATEIERERARDIENESYSSTLGGGLRWFAVDGVGSGKFFDGGDVGVFGGRVGQEQHRLLIVFHPRQVGGMPRGPSSVEQVR